MAHPICTFKLVLLGDSGVGKSCLVVKFVKGEYFMDNPPTLGATFLSQSVDLPEATIKFDIWDTAGQERYKSLAPMYYRSAAAAIIAYDITSNDSFTGAKNWVIELKRRGEQGCIIALTGTKIDLSENRVVSKEDAENYAKENDLIYFETSAKTGEGITELFTEIAKKLPISLPKPKPEEETVISPIITEKKKKDCC